MEENFLLLFRFDNPLESSVEFMKVSDGHRSVKQEAAIDKQTGPKVFADANADGDGETVNSFLEMCF